MTGARRFGGRPAQCIVRKATEAKSGTEALMQTGTQFIEECSDDSVENQSPIRHVMRGIKILAASLGTTALNAATTSLFHAKNESEIDKNAKQDDST